MTPSDPLPPRPVSPSLERIFPGHSEMAGRMRRLDWTRTALGPPAAWPDHLKQAVSLCLTSRFPILLWWGRDLTVLYNDAYISFLGAQKHPAMLGQPGRRCWSEIWPTIGPMLDGVMATGEATWSEDVQYFFARHLPAEEVFVRFTYGPILSPQGEVDGVFTPCTETTVAVVSARRLRLLTRLSVSDASTLSLQAACRTAVDCLAEEDRDVPFAAVCALQDGAVHFTAASHAVPQLPPAVEAAVRSALEGHGGVQLVDAATATAGNVAEAGTVRHFMVTSLEGARPEQPLVLLVGLSPHRPLDADYREFLALTARHVDVLVQTGVRYRRDQARVQAMAELDRAKSTFFSHVSHELRTPLMLMLGPLDDALQVDSPVREDLLMARRNAQRLHTLVDSLLDFPRLEAGKLAARLETTDLATSTADVAALFRATIEGAGLQLHVDCPALAHPYRVDRDMWQKIVSNLLSNAYKYTLKGEISVQLREVPGGVRLTVRDTGVGISAQEQARLFERFHREAPSRGRTEEGTGIGLALTKELVALHQGEISFTSTLDRGSCFVVQLPVALATPGAVAAPRQPATPAAAAMADPLPAVVSAAATGPETIGSGRAVVMIADDNADMRAYLRRTLAPYWDTRLVADGAEALQSIEQQPPDLLVCDVMMPRTGGLALVQQLRADPRWRTLPIIMVSARVGDEAKVAGLAAGADDYLIKPFSAPELVARIESQLMRARLSQVQQQVSLRLAEVLDQAPVGIAVTRGPHHVFEYCNQHFRRFVPGRTLIGRTLRDGLPEFAEHGVEAHYDHVWRSGEPFSASPLPVRWRRDEGRLEDRHLDLVCQPLVGPDGRWEGLATVASDVHEAVTARSRAEAANRAKDEFIAMLGHELRNPLAPIASAVELLRRRAQHQHWPELDIVDRQVHHMVRLIDDLLDISRITRGVVELRRAPVELGSIVAKAVETTSPLIRQRRHRLGVDVADGLPVMADADRLTQVVANLLSNAAKYTPPGGVVQVRAFRDSNGVRLDVTDDGDGLSKDAQGRIFELFVQGPQSIDRPAGGLGLGLPIARNLAQLHGGHLECASDGPGNGSTFSLWLPLCAPAAPGERPASRPAAAEAGSSLRVLLVDDNVDGANALAMLLRTMGCTVWVAHDGRAALEQLQAAAVDLALLDIGLPDMDGHELAQRLRSASAGGRPLRLVAISGYGQSDDRARSAATGFEAHLVKPVDVAALRGLLQPGR